MHRPEIVAYILQRENTKGNDITATILDLINRKYLLLEEGYRLIDVLDKDKNICIARNLNAKTNELTAYENLVIRWIIDEMGDSKVVRTANIRRELLESSLAAQKLKNYHDLLRKEIEEDKILTGNKKSNFTIYFAIFLVVLSFKFAGDLRIMITLFTLIQIAFLKIVFHDSDVKYLSDKGAELAEKWTKYKKYLDNLEQNTLNDQILIYKIALNSKINEQCLFKVIDKYKPIK